MPGRPGLFEGRGVAPEAMEIAGHQRDRDGGDRIQVGCGRGSGPRCRTEAVADQPRWPVPQVILDGREDHRFRGLVGEAGALADQRRQGEMGVVVPQTGHEVRAVGVEVAVADTPGGFNGGDSAVGHRDVQRLAVPAGPESRYGPGPGDTKALHEPEFCHGRSLGGVVLDLGG